MVNLLDAGGPEGYFDSFGRHLFGSSGGNIFSFSISNRSSFDRIHWFYDMAVNYREGERDFPMMLLGIKADLDNERQVSVEGKIFPPSMLRVLELLY